jgi:hypothetical protein
VLRIRRIYGIELLRRWPEAEVEDVAVAAVVVSMFDRWCREYDEAKMRNGWWMKTEIGFRENGRRSVGEEVTGAFFFVLLFIYLFFVIFFFFFSVFF